MKTLLALFLAAGACAVVAFAQSFPPASTAAAQPAETELLQLERAWAAAYVAADLATLERIEATEFVFTDDEGTMFTKTQDIGSLRTKEYVATAFTVDDMAVRLYGDAAVVTGRTTEKSTWKGQDTSGVRRWTDTWVRRDGRWQCVASHISKVAVK